MSIYAKSETTGYSLMAGFIVEKCTACVLISIMFVSVSFSC